MVTRLTLSQDLPGPLEMRWCVNGPGGGRAGVEGEAGIAGNGVALQTLVRRMEGLRPTQHTSVSGTIFCQLHFSRGHYTHTHTAIITYIHSTFNI